MYVDVLSQQKKHKNKAEHNLNGPKKSNSRRVAQTMFHRFTFSSLSLSPLDVFMFNV